MSKAIFFNLAGPGHVNPSLGLTAELVRRGERIIYYAPEASAEAIRATGAEFRAYPATPPQAPPTGIRHLARLKLEQSWALFPAMQAVVAQEQPDYLLYDTMGVLGYLLSRRLGLWAAASVSTFAFTPAVVQALSDQAGLAELLAGNGANPDAQHAAVYGALAAEIEAQLGVPVPDWLRSINMFGDLNIVYTSAELHPAAGRLDDSFRLVGTSLRAEAPVPGFPEAALQAQPLVYVSLGTTAFNDNAGFYQRTLRALAGRPYHVLLAVGHNVDAAALGPAPDNVTLVRFAPQLRVLQRARAFVSHGGMNSVHEALYYGVPLALVPQQVEQGVVAGQVAANGAGLVLDGASLAPEDLRAAVETLLNEPEYRAQAERLGQGLRAAGGAARAAEAVMEARARRPV